MATCSGRISDRLASLSGFLPRDRVSPYSRIDIAIYRLFFVVVRSSVTLEETATSLVNGRPVAVPSVCPVVGQLSAEAAVRETDQWLSRKRFVDRTVETAVTPSDSSQ